MAIISIPYGTTYMDVDVPDTNLAGILEITPPEKNGREEEELVRFALEHPISSPRLKDLAVGKQRILIITSDHTRPVPSRITLPLLLEEIRSGNPHADITILVATGFHRATTEKEMLVKFGNELISRESFIIHDSSDAKQMKYLGVLPSGGELWINALAAEADLLVAEGFIEPHFFAGFSGGRKSVLPGIASRTTVLANHCAQFIADEQCRTGILEGNPIHRDMVHAAGQTNLQFILNVLLDKEKRIIGAYAGHREEAHLRGCEQLSSYSRMQAVPADIVVTSNGGYPLDQNIYQAVKGMTAAEACAKQDGVIIIASECSDGHGGEAFYETMRSHASPREVMNTIMRIPMEETIPDQWESQILARILMKHTVILVTDQCSPDIISEMHMVHAYTLNEALEKAFAVKGRDASVTLIPDGVGAIIDG